MSIIARYIIISFRKYFINKLNGVMVIIDTILACGSIWLFWNSLMDLDIYTAGWDDTTLQVFIGFSIISRSFVNLTVGDYDVQRRINDGSLDMILVRPCNPLLLIMMERPDFLQFFVTFLIGFGYVFVNTKGNNIVYVLLAIVICISSTIIVYLWGTFIYILSFWFKKMDSTAELYYTMVSLSKYPLIFLAKKILVFFTYILPIAFIGTIPAEVVKGRIDFGEIIWLPVLMVITILSIFLCWKIGRIRYESTN